MITASRLRTVDTLVPGLALAAAGAVGALGIHHAVPAAPTLSLAILLGVGAANLPRARRFVQGAGRPGLSLAGRGPMRLGIVLLGYQVSDCFQS
ncbi:hypothetical protein EES40_35990 [Streptomyces sp. ADI93-02]|nr:hypothetical protein EES40_35990 [Streptomyces sp. ADI93-02]